MMSQDLFSGSRHPMDYSFKCSVPSRFWSQAPLTFASLWGGRGAGGLLSLEFRGHIPIKSPECSPQVSSPWSSEVHVAPHSEQGDMSAWKFTFSLLLYSVWGLDSSFGFSHSTPTHSTDEESEAMENLLICPESHSRLGAISVQNPHLPLPVNAHITSLLSPLPGGFPLPLGLNIFICEMGRWYFLYSVVLNGITDGKRVWEMSALEIWYMSRPYLWLPWQSDRQHECWESLAHAMCWLSGLKENAETPQQ